MFTRDNYLIGLYGTLTQLGELLALQVRIMIIGMEIRLHEPGNVRMKNQMWW